MQMMRAKEEARGTPAEDAVMVVRRRSVYVKASLVWW